MKKRLKSTISNLFKRKKIRNSNNNVSEEVENTIKDIQYYLADSPVKNAKYDRFKRAPFAYRIAHTIAFRQDPSSIVIGVYGAWGEGKTSVLNFIEDDLKKYDQIICVRFNPWLFNNEAILLKNFFQTLANAIGKSISTKKELIGKWLSDYSSIIAPFTLGISGGLLSIDPAKATQEFGKVLSNVDIEEIKKRIEKLLAEEKKRVVIIMDDIDRLDKTEVQSIFKLVKLSADFEYTAYILAFDEEMVASALGEKYSNGGIEAGRNFLEKIVQVPLKLPPTDKISLRKFCFEGIDTALNESDIKLSESETQSFVRHFIDGIEIKLNTPRMAKRYNNALSFALPLLKNETNVVDLMLIEGIRVFYPNLYDSIKENPNTFLGIGLEGYSRTDEIKKNYEEIINNSLKGLSNDEKEAIKSLLKALFPRSISCIFYNTSYGSNWDNTWDSEKRIASQHYFNRYFSYTVPVGDISDSEIDEFIKSIEYESISNISKRFISLMGERNADTLILKLRRMEKKLSPKISGLLARSIAIAGDKIPNPKKLFSFTNAFSQSAILISFLLKNITNGHERLDTGEKILREANSLEFSIECYRWIQSTEDTTESERLFSELEESRLKQILLERIRYVCNKTNIYLEYPNEAPNYLSVYASFSKDEANEYVVKTLKDSPENVINLLRIYIPTAWDADTGLPHKSNFSRDNYNSLTFVVNADVIYNAICKISKGDLNVESYPYLSGNEKDIDNIVILQFLYIYKKVNSENVGKAEITKDNQTVNNQEPKKNE